MDQKISDLDNAISLTASDLIPIVDSNGDNKKATGGQIEDFILNGKISSIGNIISTATASSDPITCASNAYTECVNITLDSGVYLLIGMLAFESNTTGIRGIDISRSSGDTGLPETRLTVNATSIQTRFQTLTVINVETNNSTFYLNAYQNSGVNLNVVYSRLSAVKISA